MKIVIFLFFLVPLFGSDWNLVYLASFPRSGNHWSRFLIEEATHIATSSIYRDKDFPHLNSRFPWGGFSTDHGYKGTCRYPIEEEAVVIKTHYPFISAPFPSFVRAICLMRHPIDAFYSFKVYKEKIVSKESLPKELPNLIEGWRSFYQFWENQPNVLFIRYEDLYREPMRYLSAMIDWIGYQVNEEDIQRAVNQYPPTGQLMKHQHHYTEEEIQLINNELKDILFKYGYF